MLLSPAGVEALRAALTGAGYTVAGIADRLGTAATAGVARNDFRAALRATEDRDPLATLIRLFVCEQTEPEPAVTAALAPLPLAEALAAGLVERHGDGLRMGLDLEPYADDWWLLSDVPASARPGQPLPAEHVLGVGGATQTLTGATLRRPVETALDLGTGSGAQALHLAGHARRVTATDVSARALRFAATTAALNGQDWELLRGDLVAPVAGRRFDLVVSNPPFVVGPGTTTHVYRDSGRVGDAVGAELAAAAPGLLNPGGTMQYLANWVHVSGQDWGERVADWFTGTGLDAWVIQREVADPMAYVNLWLADVGETADPQRAAAWLDWFDAHQVEAIGFGLVSLRRGGHDDPVVRVEDLRQRVQPPLGDQVAAWFDRQDFLRVRDTEALLAERYRAAEGLQLRQEATMGADGWEVDRQVLVQPHGLRWSEEIDPLVLALVGGADGRLPLRDQLALLAAAHDVAESELAEAAGPIVAHLVERGLIEPVPA
ncbi:SAM-dependent methyltransferase [Micromonospora yangpuensis]|uniref:Methyltransferase small domain-containing protein n=2 Tax=Micromonosporaceae TaxID=28056 RepID=A0A1C6UDJ0_9ACTN|nr:SAM-dependent methyltransferase [Micromonospora yangpuensis]SCL52001.1 Methyltransferase small domain-containing protein [Micromonospora yangpuensis]